MSDNNEPVFEFELPKHGVEPEFSAWHYKEKLTLNQLTFANHYIKHRNADAAFRYAYPKQKFPDADDLAKNPNVINYIVARLREKEYTLDDAFESSVKKLTKQIESGTPKEAKAAHKLLHATKTKLDETLAKWTAKLEVSKTVKEVERTQGITINVLPASSSKD